MSCSICFTTLDHHPGGIEFLQTTTRCGHSFHCRCIRLWLESHNNCPLCRLDEPIEFPIDLLYFEIDETSGRDHKRIVTIGTTRKLQIDITPGLLFQAITNSKNEDDIDRITDLGTPISHSIFLHHLPDENGKLHYSLVVTEKTEDRKTRTLHYLRQRVLPSLKQE